MTRLLEVAIALDQLANALLGGMADETISARCWRLRATRPYTWLQSAIDRIFFWQIDHCRSAYESEQRRSQLPTEYRNPTQPASAGFFTPTEKGRNETE